MKWEFSIYDPDWHGPDPTAPVSLPLVHSTAEADTEEEAEAAGWEAWDAEYDWRPLNPNVTITPAPRWLR